MRMIGIVELNELKIFLAVAEELHFGRAASRLHMAQPPVSRSVKALEEELGTPLFHRTTRFVSLTPAGEALLNPARRILNEVRRASDDVAATGKGEAGRVRIAFAGASTHEMVGRLARAARLEYPDIRLELSSQNFAEPAMARVLQGEVDLAMGRWGHIPTGVASRLIAKERLVVALSRDHVLADEESLSMAQLASEPFVSLPPHPGSVLTDRFRRLCHGAGFEPEVVQIAPDSWTALALVSAAVGCSLTLSTVAANVLNHHLVFIPISDGYEAVELRMAWKQDSQNAALHTLLELAALTLPIPE